MPTYAIKDTRSRTLASIVGVLAHVSLTGVATTSASNLLTVASTTGVYPGMPIFCADVPYGAFVHAVKSATVLELYASVFNQTTGVWTTSAANAQATATSSSMLAFAGGWNPVPVTHFYAMGNWRNISRSTVSSPVASGTASGVIALANGSLSIPGAVTDLDATIDLTNGVYSITPTLVQSDDAAATPLKRHTGEPWGVWTFVSTGGLISTHPAKDDLSVILTAVS